MKWLIALSLTSLCFVAVITVRLRNKEMGLGYQIAALERAERILIDQLIAIEGDISRRSAVDSLVRQAVEMRIVLRMDRGGLPPVDLIEVQDDASFME